jgi:hypothetical protein
VLVLDRLNIDKFRKIKNYNFFSLLIVLRSSLLALSLQLEFCRGQNS